MGGYIKLHRQLLEWEWYKDMNTFKVFIHLLLIANIKDTKYMGQVIKRGSKIIKESVLGEELGLTRQEVRTAIGKLIGSGEIIKKSTNKFTVISIANYEVYQGCKSEEQPTINQQSTNEQPTTNQQSTSIEEELKELKELKELNNNTPLTPQGVSDDESNGESLAIETVADEPETGSHSQTRKPRSRKASGILSLAQQQRFEMFWQAYPNKKSLGQAERTFGKLDPDDNMLQEILQGIERAKKHDSRFREQRFIPHASTWLNSQGWKDEFEAPKIDDRTNSNTRPPKPNRAANFPQRQWDFDEIEKMALGEF